MKKAFLSLALGCLMVPLPKVTAASLGSAHVSEVIQDVNLLASGAAPRKAAVNDKISEGSSVRTGGESRAELTFADLTITRLGENTVFTFREATREIHVEHGSVLLEVPPKGAEAKVSSAAATAAITGGTLMFATGPPAKCMVLEGTCIVYPTGHPEEAVTLHGGEMIMVQNGHLTKPQTFDVKAVLASAHLITDFSPLPNLPLILDVAYAQPTNGSDVLTNQPSKDLTGLDVVTVETAASPPPSGPTPPPSKFGPPSTITKPNPYVISSGTQIQTDPTITTNGVTNFGKIYRGPALDGSEFDYLFGSTSAFDTTIGEFFNTNGNGVPVAVFKFSSLELTGNPTITIPSGATTFLGLVSVGDVTSGGPGGTLTFTGLDRLFIATQGGSINLGPEIAFSGISHLTFYARGTGSNLTLASPISGADEVHLFSQGTVQINGDITASTEFKSFSGGDFLSGSGKVTAENIDIQSLSNLNINASQFPNPPTFGGSVNLNAANTLNLAIDRGGGFGWDTLTAQANTINITSPTPVKFDFSNSTSVTFTAGTGGIQAPNIDFVGSPPSGLSFLSGGSITIHSLNTEDATIAAATSFTASGDVTGAAIGTTLTAGTTVDVGGNLFVITLTAGGNINVGNGFIAGTVNAPSSILTVQGNIGPFGGEGSPQYTYNVDSIIAPAGIDFNFNGTADFVGKLTINANTLTFDKATGIAFANFNGVNADTFGSGNPASGGDGGTFIVNANGNITANNGADITATTGANAPGDNGFSGAGGTVKLTSSAGSVAVDDIIQVSSDDASANFPIRRSASGGTILLQSNLTTGQGITVGANAQLLSLLDRNAPGPGGSITLSTMGANITVSSGAKIEADRGTITMDQNDPAGSTPTITIDGATLTSETLKINGAGDVNIGLNNPVTINAVNLSLVTANDLNFGGLTLSGLLGDSSGSVVISAAQISSPGGLEIDRTFNGGLSDVNVSLSTVTDLILGSHLLINVANPISGNVASGADITLNIGGNLSDTNGDVFLNIKNSGQITGNASITASVGGGLRANNVLAQIDTTAGSITGAATVALNVTGDVTAQSPNGVLLQILNENGTIGAGAAGNGISYTAGGTTTATSLELYVDNSFNGKIANGGNLNLQTTGPVALNGPLGLEVDNYSGGTLTTGGNVTAHFHGDITDTAGSMHSLNFFVLNGGDGSFFVGPLAGGTIGTGGNINLTFDGNVATTPTATTGGFGTEIANDKGMITDGGNITVSSSGNVTARIVSNYISNQNGTITNGANITFNTTGTITSTRFTNFEVMNIGGTIGNNPEINVHAASFNVGTALIADYDNEGGSIGPGGTGAGVVSITSDGGITVGNGMWVFGQVTAGGDVNANTIGSTDVTTTGNINAGTGGITRFRFVDGNNTMPDVLHTLTATQITSTGGINFDGVASDGTDLPGNGGTLVLNASSLSFGPSGDIQGAVMANGGDAAGGSPAGNGGSLTVNTSGDISVDSDIEATTGHQDSNSQPSGNGGSVTLKSTSGMVTVDNRIEVSSNDPTPSQTPPPPIRRSASGGNITLQSGQTSGVAIDVSSSAQLLSLLDTSAPGPGGTIAMLATAPTGNSSSVNISGTVEADSGTIDIENAGDNGQINISSATLRADIVKIGALGINGQLNIGGGSISADTLLKLFAAGSNGSINFTADVTLDNQSTAIVISAVRVTIVNGVVVTIVGPDPAQVFTNLANYTGFGGNNSTTGTFGGAGAVTNGFGIFTITYLGAPAGNWSDPTSWNPNVVPNNGSGSEYNVVVGSGMLTQNISPGVTIDQLQMSGGTLQLTNPLTLNAGLQFSGGTIEGGNLFIAGPSTQSALMTVSGLTITNSGSYSITFDGSDIFSGSATFNNSGTLSKTTGTGTDNFNIPLNNSGTVSSDNGTLLFSVGGTSAGTFSASAGATVEFATNWTFTNGTHFSGAGTIQLDNSTTTNLSGTITNSGTISINSTGSLTDLRIADGTMLTGGGSVILSDSPNNRIYGTANSGTETLTNVNNTISGAGQIGAGNLIEFINQSAGVIDATSATNALIISPTTQSVVVNPNGGGFVNQGLLEATAAGGLVLSGGQFNNKGATIEAIGSGNNVYLENSVTISGGTLSDSGGGLIETAAGHTATLDGTSQGALTNAGTYQAANNSTTFLSGTIINSGTISINSTGSLTDLRIADGTTLTGGGSVLLSDSPNNRIFGTANSGTETLTNVNNTISGAGQIGAGNLIEFINQSAGVIDATSATNALIISPTTQSVVVNPNGGGFVNQGLLEATAAGGLVLSGGQFNNKGATIEAIGSGNNVYLENSVTISGGTLSDSGGGLIETAAGHTATLDGTSQGALTNAGTYQAANNSTTFLSGTIINSGTISINSTGSLTDLRIADGTMLTGGGSVLLSDSPNNRIYGTANSGTETLTNVNNTISGAGQFGAGNLIEFINQSAGVINATGTTNALIITPTTNSTLVSANGGGFVNQGLLEATNVGGLVLSVGQFNNNGGTIEAIGSGNNVYLENNVIISGGTLSTSGGGLFQNPGSTATLDGTSQGALTNAGTYQAANNSTTFLSGTIINSGTISINSTGSLTDLRIADGTMLTGGGSVLLSDSPNNRIYGTANSGTETLTNVNNTISGAGQFGAGNLIEFINQSAGVIDATSATNALIISPTTQSAVVNPNGGGFVNQGLLEATAAGGLVLSGGQFNNTGGVILADGITSQVLVNNSTSVSGGTLRLTNGGNFSIGGNAAVDQITGTLGTITVTSAGALSAANGINFNGVDGTASSAPKNGGQLTINVNSLNIGTGIVGTVTFDGGSGVNSNSTGANGGTFTVNATGDVVVGTPTSATTGENAPGTGFGGAGGTVNLHSSGGSLTVDSAIQVSSAEPTSTAAPYRSSASGGTIDLQSNLATGTGITVGSNGQLLSLLNSTAAGPGGSITLSTKGADIIVNGTIEADRGTITMDQNDPVGATPTITIDGATLTSGTLNITGAGDVNIGVNNLVTINANGTFLSTIDGNGTITFSNTDVHADVVKVGVFGANGMLIIGGSGTNTISADTLLKLYAPGSSGLLKFIQSVTLSSGTELDLAAKTITINSGVTVTIMGAGGAANVYTDTANYSATFGGNGSTTGKFAGNGANAPQPLPSATPFNPATSSTAKTANAPATPSSAPATPIQVGNSGQLLSMLANATPGSNGKITVPVSSASTNSKQSTASRLNTNGSTPAAQNSVNKAQTFSRMPATQ